MSSEVTSIVFQFGMYDRLHSLQLPIQIVVRRLRAFHRFRFADPLQLQNCIQRGRQTQGAHRTFESMRGLAQRLLVLTVYGGADLAQVVRALLKEHLHQLPQKLDIAIQAMQHRLAVESVFALGNLLRRFLRLPP